MTQETNDYLAHHGIKGQKWGVRRYQNHDGSLTAEGRKRRGIPEKESGLKKLVNSRKEKTAEKKAENAANRHENLKKYVREHPKQLYKNRAEFTKQEIDDLVQTIEADKKLKDIRDAEVQRQWNKVQNVANNLGKVKQLAENAKGVYNLACEVNNSLVDSGTFKNGKKMLKIGERPEEKKDTWFDDNLKANNFEALLNNKEKLTNTQLTDINKRKTQLDLLDKNFGSNTTYQGKHLKHCLDLRVGDLAVG